MPSLTLTEESFCAHFKSEFKACAQALEASCCSASNLHKCGVKT